MANKGRQSRSALTINGRIRLQRRWWHDSQTGSIAPADESLNRSGTTITPDALELACRENPSAASFAKAAANLARAAQLTISVVYFYSEDVRRQHMSFTRRNHEAAGKLMRREADRLRFRQAARRVAVVDGATWISERMRLHPAELDGLGLDFYHLSEKCVARDARSSATMPRKAARGPTN